MKSPFANFLNNRHSRFGFHFRRAVRAPVLVFKKDEPGYSRRLTQRGSNNGRNVSKPVHPRRITGHMKGSRQ